MERMRFFFKLLLFICNFGAWGTRTSDSCFILIVESGWYWRGQ